MRKTSLTALTRHELEHARSSSSGRSSKTVHGGHDKILRQTLIALREGEVLNEHLSPGEATIYVLHGRVLMESRLTSWSGWIGDLLIVPEENLTLKALEDSAVLYTVVKTTVPSDAGLADAGLADAGLVSAGLAGAGLVSAGLPVSAVSQEREYETDRDADRENGDQ